MTDLLNFSPASALFGILIAAGSGIYGFGYLDREVSAIRSFWKTIPVVIMAGAAIYLDASSLMIIAILLCALGDYFLSRGDNQFVLGLAAFLAGHIVYIALFVTLSSGVNLRWPMLLIGLYSGTFAVYMWGVTGIYRWPVLAYMVVITVLASVSLMLPYSYLLTLLGVFVFVLSDSILAIRMYVVSTQKVKLALSWTVWISYIVGQSLILAGVLGSI